MKRYRAQDGRFGEWLIYTCADCGEVRGEDPCSRCGNDKASVSTVAIAAERLEGAVEALREVERMLAESGVDGPTGRVVATGNVTFALARAREALTGQ